MATTALIVILYLFVGTGYALRVPVWQAPDEPAHFNYVLHITRGNGIPVLESGAYDQAYLGRLTSGRFRDGLPVDGVTYEAHQPPLYYLLLAPVAAVSEGAGVETAVRILRLSSLALGLLLLPLTWAVARLLFPHDNLLPTGAMAFVALLPQHLATLAAINNDVLAEVGVAGVLLASLLILRGRFWSLTGVIVGALLITKATAYAAASLPVLAGLLSWGDARAKGAPIPPPEGKIPTAPARRGAGVLKRVPLIYGTALFIGGIWWLRNASVYGGADFLGLVRHTEVVTGQLHVEAWTPGQVRTALVTMFQSFWLQLGWMAAPGESWIYQGLAAICGCLTTGFVVAVKRYWSSGLALCLALLLLVVLQTALYNLQFYQPQGRYLFPALVPIAVFMVLGLRELAGRRLYPAAIGAMTAGLAGLNIYAHLAVVPSL